MNADELVQSLIGFLKGGNSEGALSNTGTNTGTEDTGGGIFGNIFGGGMGDIMGGLGSLGQLYGAYKYLGHMNDALDFQKENFAFQKDAWNKNYQNQVASYNTQLKDRQLARLSADPEGKSNYASLDTYMSENRLA